MTKEDSVCIKWFKELKIEQNDKCMFHCLSARVGTSTFRCTNLCKELCNITAKEPAPIYKAAYYSGVTPEELKLIMLHPEKAVTVYKEKNKAEKATRKIFKRNNNNDENDTFRHFVWAALLVQELGLDLAKKFLDAHESWQSYTSPDRAMDVANNYDGIMTALKLKRLFAY